MKILILGSSGMLGSTMIYSLLKDARFEVWGTLRSKELLEYFPKETQTRMITNLDVLNTNSLFEVFKNVKPDIVVNCIGLIKQHLSSNDPITVLPINSIFPHQLSNLCETFQAKLVHISTDCAFSGKSGKYTENDLPDAEDLYGKSKVIGEILDRSHVVTLRTSIIGHEIKTNYGLVEWFLSQNNTVNGYINAIYSGLPTNELAKVIIDYVLPNDLSGLYHVASNPISKYELLKLVSEVYGKKIDIIPFSEFHLDRSLVADKFSTLTGYVPPEWRSLVQSMFQFWREFYV